MKPAMRRRVLKQGGAIAALVACGLLPARQALARSDDQAFDATSMADAIAAIGGVPAAGSGIDLMVPDVAENGAVVPVTVVSRLPDTREIYVVAESNPSPLIVRFTIPDGTEPFVSTRVKLAQSGGIYAVVRAGGQLYCASKNTQVMVGGCS